VTLLIGLTSVLGLVFGSFVNVLIYRVPRGESLVLPASRCPGCGSPIRPWHNVPVLSYLVLRGRCATCADRISPVYPAVELVTAGLFVAITVRLKHLDLITALPAYLYFTLIAVALAAIDLRHRRLPNAIVLPSYPVLAALLAASAAVHRDWAGLARAGIGAAALLGGFLLISVVHPAAMGLGDVKLAGLVGAVLGYLSWSTLILGTFGGFLLGAVFGLALIARGRGTGKTAIPFGPFMLAGALLGVFVATPLARFYWDTVIG
jgi:leader peptidase (prepilin peptidase) / N-methyltransferase